MAMVPVTYRWDASGLRESFVQCLEVRGEGVVCTLAMPRLIESCPEGQDLVWQVQAFLLRLARRRERSV